MNLMIFDPHDRGHYFSYVRYLLTGATCADRVILVLRQGVMQSVPYERQLRPWLKNVEVFPESRDESYRNGAHLLEDFQIALKRHKPDHVWVPSGDLLVRRSNVAHALRRWRFPMDVEGECGMIDINFHRRPRRWRGYVRQFLERTLLRFGPWKRVHTIDPLVFTWVKQRGGKLSERFHLLPEPVEEFPRISKESARRSLGIPQEGRYIGSAGVHTMPYKGTQLLVEAFSRAELLPTDRLLIAGPLGDNLMHRLNTEFAQLYHSGRIVVVDKYLTEVDLMTSLAAMDLVCTPYSDHLGSSAIVIRAAQAGRPVLAPHAGWFAEIIPPFQLGDTGPILEITTLAAELKTALERSERFRVSLGCERLIEYSKSDNFARLWASRLRERIGLPLDKDLRTWEWVLQALPES